MYIRDLERFAPSSRFSFFKNKIKIKVNARPTPSEVKKWRSISLTFTVFSKPWRQATLPNPKYKQRADTILNLFNDAYVS
jgi:hypothetical protein